MNQDSIWLSLKNKKFRTLWLVTPDFGQCHRRLQYRRRVVDELAREFLLFTLLDPGSHFAGILFIHTSSWHYSGLNEPDEGRRLD